MCVCGAQRQTSQTAGTAACNEVKVRHLHAPPYAHLQENSRFFGAQRQTSQTAGTAACNEVKVRHLHAPPYAHLQEKSRFFGW